MSTPQIAFRNRDWEFAVFITDNEGAAVDITGSSWKLHLRSVPGITPELINTPSIDGAATDGQLSVMVLAANMSMLAGNYTAELYRTDSGADVVATWDVTVADEGQVFGAPGDVFVEAADGLTIQAINAPVAVAGGAGGVTDGDKGDIIVSGSGLVWTIDANVVDFTKLQDITSDRLLGRDTAGAGNPEEISVSGGLEFTGSAGIQRSALTGDVTASAGSNATTIAAGAVSFAKMQDIATDSLIGRDTAGTGDPENITLNATLSMTGAGALQRAALTGDITAAAGSNATTLATVNGNVGTFGSATQVAQLTANGKGLVTAVTNVSIAVPSTAVTDFAEAVEDVVGALLPASEGTGDLDWTYVDATPSLNAAVKADAITYAKMQNVSVTDRVLGRDTAGAGDVEELTASAVLDFVGTTRGSILYRGASGWAILAPGTATHVLTSNGAGADPTYQAGGGGGGTPGGADTQVQYNNAGAFGGDAGLTYNAATDALTIGGSVLPDTNDGAVIGSTTLRWSDVFLADGGVIDLGASGSRATLTHVPASDSLTIAADPDNATASSVINLSIDGTIEAILNATNFTPGANDGNALGSSTVRWGDLFGADGSVIDLGAAGSRATITHVAASDSVIIAADPDNATASTQISFTIDGTTEFLLTGTAASPGANDGAALGTTALGWADLFLATGGVINWATGNATITHSTGLLTSNVDIAVPDEAYGVGWDGSLEVPTKNALYDKIETMGGGGGGGTNLGLVVAIGQLGCVMS